MSSMDVFLNRPPLQPVAHFARLLVRALCKAILLLALVAVILPADLVVAASSLSSAPASEPSPFRTPPLPIFEGRTLDGSMMSSRSFPGKRLVLFCFNPGVDQAVAYAEALGRIAPDRLRANFAIVGVALGLDSAEARKFAAAQKLDFPIFDDSDGQITAMLGLQSPLMLVGSDADGRVGFAVVGMADEEAPSVVVLEARLRDFLRLPAAATFVDGRLGQLPKAPPFEGKTLGAGETLRLADLSGRPLVLAFFLSTCPHCQAALRFFKDELARMPEKSRPALLGIAIDNQSWDVEEHLKEKNLDFFSVLSDSDHKIATSYGSFARVPDILLIDASGRILFRDKGWDDARDPDLMRMRLAQLVGNKVPMLLRKDDFSGNEACAVCHAKETETWRFTHHATAFDTLVARAADHDPKCVGCHVVGFGEKGGWSIGGQEERFEGVGCENCHGRGGGHLEQKPKAGATAVTDYRAACLHCHDSEHSLGFEYGGFLPKVSHATIAAMSDADRAKLVADRGRPRDLLPNISAFAGSTICGNCHAREYDIWSHSAHARSVESLKKKGKDEDGACVTCHVTGYARPGGFPPGDRVRSHEDLARVGCESCHGPGADHVRTGGKQSAGVVQLGDKCDSCVILQICGSCHDDANDPGFGFDVKRKIEVQRHGAAAPAH